MLYLSLLLLIVPQAPTATAPQQVPPATPEVEAVTYDQGPMRVDLTAMREVRTKYLDDAERSARESNYAIQASTDRTNPMPALHFLL